MTAPTRAEVREHVLIDNFPPDSRMLLDFDNPRSNVYLEADAIAGAVKAHAFDIADQMVREALPSTATSGTGGMLGDWEGALGILAPASAASTTDSQRQVQVTARMREFGVSSLSNIRTALETICGSGVVTILEHTRAQVSAVNWYDITGLPLAIPASADLDIPFVCGDNTGASQAGAQCTVRITHPAIQELSLTFIAPDAAQSESLSFGSGAAAGRDFRFFWPGAAGKAIDGTWTVRITDSGSSGGTVDDPAGDGISGLLVEGIGRGLLGTQGMGSAVFRLVILLRESAVSSLGYSRRAAMELARRWTPGHCEVNVCFYNSHDGPCGIWDDINAIWDCTIWDA